MSLKILFYKQENDYYCGPACMQMVLGFFGISKTQEELAISMGTTEEVGTDNLEMVNYALKEGFYVKAREGFTIEEIKEAISMEVPVIVDFIEPVDDIQHFGIVTGFEGENIILNDPFHGENFSMSVDSFVERWHDPNKKRKQWAMAMSKDDVL